MSLPHWELSVLSKAVAYPNLSGAAANVGLSQPQLSRIVAKLEEELGISLLDRSSRRKSGWTAIALKLAETYAEASSALEQQLRAVAVGTELAALKLGTLEGLATLSTEIAHGILESRSSRELNLHLARVDLLEVDVYELHDLEEHYLGGKLDLLVSSRVPGRGKPRHSRLLGYQTLERISSPRSNTQVLSSFEHRTRRDSSGRHLEEAPGERRLVSNSLAVRRRWLERFGGTGLIPSPLRERTGEGGPKGSPVYLIGADRLPTDLWREIASIQVEA